MTSILYFWFALTFVKIKFVKKIHVLPGVVQVADGYEFDLRPEVNLSPNEHSKQRVSSRIMSEGNSMPVR